MKIDLENLSLQGLKRIIMNKTIAHIEISTPKRKSRDKVPEKQKKVVTVQNPLNQEITEEKTYTHEEVFGELIERLNEHYGTNYKLKY
jgi:hypothetical protein